MSESVTITVECFNCHTIIPVAITLPYAVTSHTDADPDPDPEPNTDSVSVPYTESNNLPDPDGLRFTVTNIHAIPDPDSA